MISQSVQSGVEIMDFVDEFYAEIDFSLLKKLTLVIPTFNRNYYISRCLWYHAHFPFGEIIVADSSPEEKKVVNRETVAKVREMFGANIRYLEYEPETEKYGGDIYRKWGDALKYVKTEYSIIPKDKDFLIPTVLIKELSILEERPDISAVVGRTGYMRLLNNSEESREFMTYTKKETFSPLNQEKSLDRAKASMLQNSANPYIHTLYRTAEQVYRYNELKKYNINDIRFGEIALNLLSIIRNKSEFINQYERYEDRCMLRKSGDINKLESSSTRYPFFDVYIKEGIFDTYYQRFEECIIENLLLDNSELTHDERKEFLKQWFNEILSGKLWSGNPPIYRILVTLHIPVDRIWYFMPKRVKLGLSKLHLVPNQDDDGLLIRDDEMKIIDKFISNTIRFCNKDNPITYENSDKIQTSNEFFEVTN